mgnify:CR=1 FL=1
MSGLCPAGAGGTGAVYDARGVGLGRLALQGCGWVGYAFVLVQSAQVNTAGLTSTSTSTTPYLPVYVTACRVAARVACETTAQAVDAAVDDGTYVWGTNINSRQLRSQIEAFIRQYRSVGGAVTR